MVIWNKVEREREREYKIYGDGEFNTMVIRVLNCGMWKKTKCNKTKKPQKSKMDFFYIKKQYWVCHFWSQQNTNNQKFLLIIIVFTAKTHKISNSLQSYCIKNSPFTASITGIATLFFVLFGSVRRNSKNTYLNYCRQ